MRGIGQRQGRDAAEGARDCSEVVDTCAVNSIEEIVDVCTVRVCSGGDETSDIMASRQGTAGGAARAADRSCVQAAAFS